MPACPCVCAAMPQIGEPYAGFTCFGYGSGSLSVSVEEVSPRDLHAKLTAKNLFVKLRESSGERPLSVGQR